MDENLDNMGNLNCSSQTITEVKKIEVGICMNIEACGGDNL